MGTIKTNNNFLSDVATGYIEVSREYSGGDGTGRQIGGKYQITENGPYSEATVVYSGTLLDTNNPTAPRDPTEEEPNTRYEFRTEYVDASLFELPQVRAEAKRYISEEEYYSVVKLAGEDPKNNKLPMPESQFPLAYQLTKRLSRGQTSFQTSRCSLTRISSYSALNGLPATPPIISAVYDGPQLANYNFFPASVRNVMPRPPANLNLTPEGTVWAWLKTNDSTSLTIKTNQVERNETWTFAAWDLFAYPYNVPPNNLT